MRDKFVQGIIWITIAYVIGTWLYNFVESSSILSTTESKRNFRTELTSDPSGEYYTFTHIDKEEFPGNYSPAVGDTLLTLNNMAFSDSLHKVYFQNLSTPKGESLQTEIGTILGRLDLSMEHVDRSKFALFLPLFVIGLLPIPFFVVAIWAMIRQGQNAGVKVLSLLIISFSVIFTISMEGMAIGIKSSAIGQEVTQDVQYILNVFNIPNLFLSSLGSGFWLHLAFLFPSPAPLIRKRPWIVYLLSYVVGIPFIYNLIFNIQKLLHSQDMMENSLSPISIIVSLYSFVQIVAGAVIMIQRFRKTDSALEKRQLKVVLQSVGVGMFMVIVCSTLMLFAYKQDDIPVLLMGITFLILLISLMLIPLGFAYAFSRYRLLEVQGRLKRGLSFFLTTGGLLLVVFMFFFVLINITLRSLGIESRNAVVFYSLLTAIVYFPLHNLIQKRIERMIFRTRIKMQEMLNSFLAITSSFPDRKSLWETYGRRLQENIGVKHMHILFMDKENQSYNDLEGSKNYFPVDGVIQKELNQRINPLLIDEFKTRNDIVLKSDEDKWLTDNDILALVPIQLHGDVVGVMALEFEYGYDEIKAEELDLLVSMTNRVALESENIGLLEERIEKNRMEEQLAMARTVQEQILPSKLPETPGILLSAQCRFCLEVAGDMFDVIELSDNKTLVTIGDVSGKGAGAAMIMANLQAAIRALAVEEMPLKRIIKRANEELFKTTSPEQYITYFAAVIDPGSNEMTYVNAGHNSPILVRNDGKVDYLDEGGMILGALSFSDYDETTIPFEKGDILVAYTDGISEAENEEEIMYGEEALEELVLLNLDKQPEEIADVIIETINQYQGDAPATDDITLVILQKL